MDNLIDYKLYLKDKKTSIYEILNHSNNPIIGLYFSGNYCPSCKYFTPKLIEIYNEIKKDYNNFEIIFISSDKTMEDYLNYYNEMPWYSLPYKKRDLKEALCNQFNVKTIPSLIFFNKEGKIIESEGRNLVDKYFYNTDKLIENLIYLSYKPNDNIID